MILRAMIGVVGGAGGVTTKRERSVVPRLNGGDFYTQWPFSWPDHMTSLNFIKN